MRPVLHLLMVLALTVIVACRTKLPRNPILENCLVALDEEERRFAALPPPGPTPADHLELGIARYRVWRIYLSRSRNTNVKKATWNRRMADRREAEMIAALERAAEQASDLPVAARAKYILASVHEKLHDWDKQIAMLQRILVDHPDRNYAYNCHRDLAGAYQQQGKRQEAIDSLSRMLLLIEEWQDGRDIDRARGHVLGRLLTYEPRVVLPSYRRLLLAGTGKILQRHAETAPNRIELTVDHFDDAGMTVSYRVVFPAYLGIIEQWEERMKIPRVRLPDDFYYYRKPTYHLSFREFPTTGDFTIDPDEPACLAPRQFSPALVFDQDNTATGKVLLKWSIPAMPHRDLYLTAMLCPQFRVASPVPGRGEVFMEPVRTFLKVP